jgi:hypothetical protein
VGVNETAHAKRANHQRKRVGLDLPTRPANPRAAKRKDREASDEQTGAATRQEGM